MNRRTANKINRFVFVFPAMVLFTVFFIYPALKSFYYSFLQWDGVSQPVFVGLSNYTRIFTDKTALIALMNTFKFTVFNIVIQNPLCLLLAVLLIRPLKSKTFLRTTFYLPTVISLIAVSVTFSNILGYEGILNSVLGAMGFGSHLVDWLGNYDTAFYSILLIIVWGGLGGGTVIYISGLQSIPIELYEAAYIDGINEWSKFRWITFPLLMPSVTIVTFLGLSGTLKIFDLPFILTGGGPGTQTLTMAIYIYKKFGENLYGYSTALGIIYMVIIISVVALQMKLTREREVEL